MISASRMGPQALRRSQLAAIRKRLLRSSPRHSSRTLAWRPFPTRCEHDVGGVSCGEREPKKSPRKSRYNQKMNLRDIGTSPESAFDQTRCLLVWLNAYVGSKCEKCG